MLSSSVRWFSEPDEFAANIRSVDADIIVNERGSYGAKVSTVDFHDLWILRLSEHLPQTIHVDGLSGTRVFITFQTQPGPPLVRRGGELPLGAIQRASVGKSYYQRTSGPTAYGCMSLPLAAMASISTVLVGRDLTLGDDLAFQPPVAAMARLQRLHETAGCLAEDAAAVLAHPQAARGLEQALTEAMFDCLRDGGAKEDSAARGRHAAIMRRFHRVIEQHVDEPLYVLELSREIGTSLRTLNMCCRDHLGVGPKHYLLLRRMNLARRALRRSMPSETTVTEIATGCGFWELGRFAVEYKRLFGEMPSATLARAP